MDSTLGQFDCDSQLASRMLLQLFSKYPKALVVRLWDGKTLRVGKGAPAFTLSLRHPGVLRDLVLYRSPVYLAEAYCGGEVEVSGNFDAAVRLRYYLERLQLPLLDRVLLAWRAFWLGSVEQRQDQDTVSTSRLHQNSCDSIAFHYDVSNAFYRLWLDVRMVYSCAYFESPEQDLDLAQRNKLDYICRKLRLR